MDLRLLRDFGVLRDIGFEDRRGLIGRVPTTSAPSAASFSFTSGTASAFTISWLSRCTTSREVFTGATAPYQVVMI